MSVNSKSLQKYSDHTPSKVVFKLKSNSVHPQPSKNTDFKNDRNKTFSHHTSTILNQFNKPSRNSSYQTRSNSMTRNLNLKIHQAPQMNLMEKLAEIQSIRNYQTRTAPLLKKRKVRRRQYLMNENWDIYVKNDKISKNTYEKVKQKFKEKKDKQKYTIFTYYNKENLQKSQLQMLATEKPNDFCHFVNGFPDSSITGQFQHRNNPTKLSIFQQKLKSSQTLKKICKILDKKGHFQRGAGKELNKSFLSTVQVLSYVNKNGYSDQKSKNMMKKIDCIS